MSDETLQIRLDDDSHSWFEFRLSASFEFIPDFGEAAPAVRYSDAFEDTAGVDVQLAWVYAFVPTVWKFDTLVGPHVGYTYRSFDGSSFNNPGTASRVEMDELTIHTLYVGGMFGAGTLPKEGEFGLITYIKMDLGIALLEDVGAESPAIFPTKQEYLKSKTNFYISGGLGVQMRFGSFAAHVEFGMRHFGKPDRSTSVIAATEDGFAALYLLLGASLSF